MPTLTLPITRGGLALTDRACWALLAAAMVIAAGLILWLNRGTTFFFDEVAWFYGATDLDLRDVFVPHNGHLIVTTRLASKAILETVGTEYLAFRLLAVLAVLLSAGLFYALVKRWIGAVAALAPALVLLFFGSAWQHVVVPVGFTVIFGIAAGLAALLALERGDRRGDVAACVLLLLSLATYTTGLPFLVGAGVSVLIRPDRRRRAWVFVVPLALYAAWWVWSLDTGSSSEQETSLANILLIPSYVAESLALTTAAITGLDYDFAGPAQPEFELGWGRVVAALALVALALRIRRGSVPAALWVGLGIVLAYWVLGALAVGAGRGPTATRYVYPGSVGVLLVAAAAASGIRFSRLGMAALFAAAAVSLATNIALLRDGAALFRSGYSSPVRAQLAMLELAADHVNPFFDPVAAVPDAAPDPPPEQLAPAGIYLGTSARFGSPAFTLPELARQSEDVRRGADQVLAAALDLELVPSSSPARGRGCRRIGADPQGGSIDLEIPAGGARIGVRGAGPASVSVGRFAGSPAAELGSVSPGEAVTLKVPRDSSPTPWRASVTGARAVTACALR